MGKDRDAIGEMRVRRGRGEVSILLFFRRKTALGPILSSIPLKR